VWSSQCVAPPVRATIGDGPEYISGKLLEWAEKQGIAIQHIKPGKPQQHAYIERYNRTVRHEWLDQHIIENIEEAQDFATQLLWTYNNLFRALLRNTLPGSGPPEHGHRRRYARTETENGCLSYTPPSH
jgi:transposase InsO family protein